MPGRVYEALRDRMADVTGVVMLLGAAETGKTTLAKLLILDALDAGLSVAYVDGDVASTVAGPPACVGLKYIESPADLDPDTRRLAAAGLRQLLRLHDDRDAPLQIREHLGHELEEGIQLGAACYDD